MQTKKSHPVFSKKIGRRAMLAGVASASAVSLVRPTFSQIAPTGQKLAALCIGIDQYQSLSNLERAVADANTVADKLTGIGYDVTRSINPGIDEMIDDFLEFQFKLDSETAAFLFIAAHGMQVSGQNYILPSDVPRLDNDDALSGAITMDNWLSAIARAEPSQAIAVLDACRNQEVRANITGSSNGLASTNAPGGLFVAYSAATGEYALDNTGENDCYANGLFTRHFADELKPGARIYDAISNTRARVIPDAREVGHAQHPAIYDQSGWPYRIDGARSSDPATSSLAAGQVENTGLVIVTSANYDCIGYSLVSPNFDAVRVEQLFHKYGADVTILHAPDKDAVIDACRNVGSQGYDRLLFYFMGLGGCSTEQAACILPKNHCGESTLPLDFSFEDSDLTLLTSWFDILSHSDIIRAFRSGSNDASNELVDTSLGERKIPSIIMFYDACLTVGLLSQKLEMLDFSTHDKLQDIEFQDSIALLSASSMFQPSFDLVEGTTSSPFTIAMLNALAIPGLSLAQLTDRVRSEVETLTDRKQTPRLFSSESFQNQIVVSPREHISEGDCTISAG